MVFLSVMLIVIMKEIELVKIFFLMFETLFIRNGYCTKYFHLMVVNTSSYVVMRGIVMRPSIPFGCLSGRRMTLCSFYFFKMRVTMLIHVNFLYSNTVLY